MTTPLEWTPLWCRGCRAPNTGEVYRGELGLYCGECTGDAALHPGTADEWVGDFCFCGRAVFRLARRGLRGTPSCTEACRRAAENEVRRPRRRRGPRQVGCHGCDATFTARRSSARWCSPSCRQRAYRSRQGRSATAALTAS